VIFDCDGMLVDSEITIFRGMERQRPMARGIRVSSPSSRCRIRDARLTCISRYQVKVSSGSSLRCTWQESHVTKPIRYSWVYESLPPAPAPPRLAEAVATVKYPYAYKQCKPAYMAALPDERAGAAIGTSNAHRTAALMGVGLLSLGSRQAPRFTIPGQRDLAVPLQLAKRVADRGESKFRLVLLLDRLPNVASPAGMVG
jgi:hypothetical protein